MLNERAGSTTSSASTRSVPRAAITIGSGRTVVRAPSALPRRSAAEQQVRDRPCRARSCRVRRRPNSRRPRPGARSRTPRPPSARANRGRRGATTNVVRRRRAGTPARGGRRTDGRRRAVGGRRPRHRALPRRPSRAPARRRACDDGSQAGGASAPLGNVEPVGDVARSRGRAVGRANRRTDPVALALERVRRQADPAPPLRPVEGGPVDVQTELPHAPQRRQRPVEARARAPRRSAASRPCARSGRWFSTSGRRTSSASGPARLREDHALGVEHLAVAGQHAEAVLEAHRRTQLGAPGLGVRRLACRPRPRSGSRRTAASAPRGRPSRRSGRTAAGSGPSSTSGTRATCGAGAPGRRESRAPAPRLRSPESDPTAR